jgi:hypothetical protein
MTKNNGPPRPPMLPFVDLGCREWRHLGLAVLVFLLALVYGTYVFWSVKTRGIFEYVGIDYRLWLASVRIIRDHGFASIYDPSLQAEYQLPLYQDYSFPNRMRMPFWALPFPYLTLFVTPMLPLLLFPPVVGFLLWVFANAMLLLLYLWNVPRRMNMVTRRVPLALLFLSLPVFLNPLFAQVNVWLLIALGESLVALKKGRDLRAGIWLAGLLLKPQTLIFFLPGLLLGKKIRMLTGFVLASTVLGFLSLLLGGPSAPLMLLRVIRQWPTVLAESGMNWRALALQCASVCPIDSTWLVLWIGSIATTAAALGLWFSSAALDHPSLLFIGTYAATCATTWHGNIHMALPILAPLILLWIEGTLPTALAGFWLLLPTIMFLTAAFTRGPGAAHNCAGIGLLVANLLLLAWAVYVSRESGTSSQHID